MAARTAYATLEFNRGELKHVDEASSADMGIDSTDLRNAELAAMRRINQFILRIAGPIKGAAIVSIFADDQNPLDPIIIQLAEYVAAADILDNLERFDHASEGQEGQTQRKDADVVRGLATRIVDDIADAGGTFTSTGAFRRWAYSKGQQGMRVGGVNASGSRFDPRGYRNVWGELLPGPYDPYDTAKR